MKFCKSILLFLMILKLESTVFATSSVVINEALANEPGNLTRLEWVELFNTDSMQVNLSGWKFVSKSDTTTLEDVSLPGKGYIVLVRQLVTTFPDTNSFEAFWGNNSGVWGDSEMEDFPALEARMSLTNKGGTVSLIDPEESISSFTWDKDWGDKVSWEKIDPAGDDSLENWTRCLYFKGSTPGKINSVTPASNDLSVQSEDISILPENPREFEYFEIKVRVRNKGTQKSLPNQLIFFCDYDFNSQLQTNEILGEPQAVIPVDVDGYLDFSMEQSFARGNYRIYAQVDRDDKNYNNSAFIDVKIGSQVSELIINEFMCSPDLSQPEWVELFNRSDSAIFLKNWSLGDSTQQNLITSEDVQIFPGDYLIVTENAAEFYSTYPEAVCQVIEQSQWMTLNNTGDKIILKDSLNFIIEQVAYTNDWGKSVSFERADPDRISSDSDNWWRSVDPDGATPCEKNSLEDGYSQEIELNIKPN